MKGSYYENDIHQYATGAEAKAVAIFEDLPGQLQRHDRYFQIDFLIAKSKITSRHNICPIEVKSGRRKFTTSSLEKFNSKYHEQLHTSIVLHDGDVQQKDGVMYLPLYMTPLL